jgi:hypothetical protein
LKCGWIQRGNDNNKKGRLTAIMRRRLAVKMDVENGEKTAKNTKK